MSEAAYVKPETDVQTAPVHFVEEVTAVRTSPTLGKLAEALAKAQLTFDAVTKDMENPAYTRGPKKSKYADLHAFIGATRSQLASNGLVLMQFPHANGDRAVTITSRLQHVSNEYIETDLKLSAVGQGGRFDIQTVGSAITYGRRYARGCILDVAAEEDDDGNSAAGVGSKQAADDVAKQKLTDLSKHADPHIAGMAKDSLAKINAVSTAKDLEGTLKASLESQKDDGLFDTFSGTVQQVRQMATSPAKGNRPYRKIALTIIEKGELKDVEVSAFDNFKMSDTTCFAALDDFTTEGGTATLIVERSGKYLNLKDIKQLGDRQWDNRLGVVNR